MTIEETEEILDDNYVEIDRTTYNDDGEYINEIKGSNNFFETNEGKFLKNLTFFGVNSIFSSISPDSVNFTALPSRSRPANKLVEECRNSKPHAVGFYLLMT